MKIRLFKDGFPASLKLMDGKLLNAAYESSQIVMTNDPSELALPKEFSLGQNFPNPFNPTTVIPFRVPALDRLAAHGSLIPVSLDIYNSLGQKIRTVIHQDHDPGYYRVVWDGKDEQGRSVGTGMYLYRVRAGTHQQVKKMTLLR